jgi:hypothetical protein
MSIYSWLHSVSWQSIEVKHKQTLVFEGINLGMSVIRRSDDHQYNVEIPGLSVYLNGTVPYWINNKEDEDETIHEMSVCGIFPRQSQNTAVTGNLLLKLLKEIGCVLKLHKFYLTDQSAIVFDNTPYMLSLNRYGIVTNNATWYERRGLLPDEMNKELAIVQHCNLQELRKSALDMTFYTAEDIRVKLIAIQKETRDRLVRVQDIRSKETSQKAKALFQLKLCVIAELDRELAKQKKHKKTIRQWLLWATRHLRQTTRVKRWSRILCREVTAYEILWEVLETETVFDGDPEAEVAFYF